MIPSACPTDQQRKRLIWWSSDYIRSNSTSIPNISYNSTLKIEVPTSKENILWCCCFIPITTAQTEMCFVTKMAGILLKELTRWCLSSVTEQWRGQESIAADGGRPGVGRLGHPSQTHTWHGCKGEENQVGSSSFSNFSSSFVFQADLL